VGLEVGTGLEQGRIVASSWDGGELGGGRIVLNGSCVDNCVGNAESGVGGSAA
jgi:hypothetical protein